VYQNAFNVKLPRLARQQASSGRAVQLAHIEAGDLLFYDTQGEPNSHVGIYIGDGRFVHAPRSGAKVRVERIESGYWRSRFNGARRIEIAASS
jgi:cell wall-associated NlpC family hydrolase